MALNTYIIKKWGALFSCGFFPGMIFYIGLIFYGFWLGLLFLLGGMVLGMVISNILLRNPFSKMLEGKGLLVLNIDSTGIIRPFIVGLNQPYIRGKFGKENVNDVYDRESVNSISQPIQAGNAITADKQETKSGGIDLHLSNEEFNKSRFALWHYPALIYNAQLKTLLTKDYLSGMEKQSFSEHGVLYLNRKMEELNSSMRDFGRYVVDQLKPKESFLKGKFAIILIIIVIAVLIFIFGGPLIDAIKSMTGGIASSGGSILGAASPVTPR